MSEEQKPLTMREIGRHGGNKTKEKCGPEHYPRIGRKGGQRTRELIERAKAWEKAQETANDTNLD